ncbi:hypothetical protein WUBG_15690 [Wuchereria bancrofti]|uniref:RING-type E3 ubiquitin transferase n=1 Tax=Wuchereria bancrofti TaxID=6293 RepID=J9E8T9_WUCBA|nr:hypothetical protein WUBG_15690 [Wuchereria bancrofti]
MKEYRNGFSSLGSLPLCPYFETGDCDKGDKCQFVHGDVCDLCNVPCLHPTDTEQRAQHRRECIDAHEAAMEEAFAEARSADIYLNNSILTFYLIMQGFICFEI